MKYDDNKNSLTSKKKLDLPNLKSLVNNIRTGSNEETCLCKGGKHYEEKEKMPVTNILLFSNYLFKSFLCQSCEISGFYDKGLTLCHTILS